MNNRNRSPKGEAPQHQQDNRRSGEYKGDSLEKITALINYIAMEPAGGEGGVKIKSDPEIKTETGGDAGARFNVEGSSLCNLLVYTSGESSSSDSEDDSNDSDSYDCGSEKETDQSKNIKDKGETLADTLKTIGELSIDDLPPVPDVTCIKGVREEECEKIGQISSIIDKLVMVESIPNKPAYDVDTLLFLDSGKQPLGYIFDVIGSVTCPMYAIRFNSKEEIAALNISKGLPVFSAPKSEHTQYVFVQQLLQNKGSDASWKNDMEVPQEHADYSDDEAENRTRYRPIESRKRSSLERHRNFEKDMNVKNLIDTRLHRIKDNFDPAAKKPAPNFNRGCQFQLNYRPSFGFPNVSGTSCAYPAPPPFTMPPFMPAPMAYGPQSLPPFVPSMPPPNFVPGLPPPLPNLPPYPPMQAYAGQDMVNPMFQNVPIRPQSQAKSPPGAPVYPPDMGLPRPPSQNPSYVPSMPFYDPRIPVWHNYPNPPVSAQQPFPKPARNYFPKRQ